MSQPKYPIKLRFLPIADGIWGSGSDKHFHVCVQVFPYADEEGRHSLENLPQAIEQSFGELARGKWLQIGNIPPFAAERTSVGWDACNSSTPTYAERLWAELFERHWDWLYESLKTPSQRPVAEPQRTVKGVTLQEYHSDVVSVRGGLFELHSRQACYAEASRDPRTHLLPNVKAFARAKTDERKKRVEYWKKMQVRAEGIRRMRSGRLGEPKNGEGAILESREGFLSGNEADSVEKRIREEVVGLWDSTAHEPVPHTEMGVFAGVNPDAEEAKSIFGKLQGDPRLATLLGLMINVRVLPTQCQLSFVGAVDVVGEMAVVGQQLKSSYILWLDGMSNSAGFQPASRSEVDRALSSPGKFQGDENQWRKWLTQYSSDMVLEKGFVNLSKGAFGIRMLDTVRMMAGEAAQTKATNRAITEGSDRDHVADRWHTPQSPGIELVHGNAHAAFEDRMKIQKSLLKKHHLGHNEVGRLFLAEDLVVGYRVDIERTGVGGSKQSPVWASAVARKAVYAWEMLDMGKPPGQRVHEWDHSVHGVPYRHRDDGFVSFVPRKLIAETHPSGEAVSTGEVHYVFDSLFTWTGESLGLPSDDLGKPKSIWTHFAKLKKSYDFVPEDGGRLPFLRLGHGYRIALRCRFLHGGGPLFDRTAASRSDSLHDQYSIGLNGVTKALSVAVAANRGLLDHMRQPFPFLPSDPVKAPIIAVLDDDPLVPEDQPGLKQRVDRVLLRSEIDGGPRTVTRVLLPPRVSAETAEIQGQFDRFVNESVPPGALRWMELCGDIGNPGNETLPSNETLPNGRERDPAPIVRIGTHVGEYYCDARARCVSLELTRDGDDHDDLPSSPLVVDFWSKAQGPNDARPVVVRFVQKSGIKGAQWAVQSGSATALSVVKGMPVTEVVLFVSPGDEVVMKVSCHDHAQGNSGVPTAFACNSFIEMASHRLIGDVVANSRGDAKGVRDLICRGLGKVRSDVIQDQSQLRILSAVRRPVAPLLLPGSLRDSAEGGGTPVFVVRLSSAVDQSLKSWSTYWETNSTLVTPQGGAVGFLAADVKADHRSTAHVRLQAVWKDYDDAVALVSKEHQGKVTWAHEPVVVIREFLPSIPVHPLVQDGSNLRDGTKDGEKLLSLVFDELHVLRNVRFDLGTAALRLGIRAIGVSRFQDCYRQSGLKAGRETDGKLLCEDASFEAANFTIKEFENMDDDPQLLELPATVGPSIPEIVRGKDRAEVEYVFCRKEDRCGKGLRVTCRTWWSLRIRFVRGSWFKSGVGEMFAVLLPTSTATDARASGITSAAPSSESGWLNSLFAPWFAAGAGETSIAHRELTWWAAAPDTVGGSLPEITPDCFLRGEGCCGEGADQTDFPVPGIDKKCSIITYMPVLDPNTGERFVDIDLLPPAVDSPFVRLTVARYQPLALFRPHDDPIDLRMSPVVNLDPVPLPPRRELIAEWIQGPGGAWSLVVTVTGTTYRDRCVVPTRNQASPLTGDDGGGCQMPLVDSSEGLHRPWMCIRVLRPALTGGGFVLTSTADGQPAEWKGYYCHHDGVSATWEHSFPFGRRPGAVKVFAEEVEKHQVEKEEPHVDGNQSDPEVQSTPRAFKCEVTLASPSGG